MKKHILLVLFSLLAVGFWNHTLAQQTVTLSISNNAICVGDTVILTATATGSPISYQWFLNGQAIGIPTPGNTFSYVFNPNVQGQQFFSVRANYQGGSSVQSNFVSLIVGAPQVFFVQPTSQQNCGPGDFSFFAFVDSVPSSVIPTVLWDISGPGGFSTTATGQNPLINLPTTGTYTMVLTSFANPNCSATFNYSYTVNSPIALNPTVTNPACGLNDGSIDLTPTGGTVGVFLYQWSNGATSPSINNLAAGTYSVVVSDSGLCALTDTFTLVETGVLDYTIAVTDVNCLGDSTGSIDITPVDSAGPITYLWSTGETTQDLNNI
ncbi:MAG: hypothetical protein AAFR59_19350, partial [Bacteroidota bacterium]